MIISLVIFTIFFILSLVTLSVFVKIKYCGKLHEYFKNKRDEKLRIGEKFYGISQKLVFGTIFLFSILVVLIQLIVSIPQEAGGAFHGVTGNEYSTLNYLNKYKNNEGDFSEFVNKYKARKLEGLKSVFEYEEMLATNIQTVEGFYQYKKEEAEKRAKAIKDEEIRIANEKAEAKIAEQAATKGMSVEEFKRELEQVREAKEKAEAAAKVISECKANYASCSNNEMLINNYPGVNAAKAACMTEGKKLAKWDSDFPYLGAFGTFFIGNNYPSTGVITIQEDHAKFQNGFGAWQKRSVRCRYDLKSKSVEYVEVL